MQSSLLWNAPFFPLSIFAALFFAQSARSFALTALFFPQEERHLSRASYTYIWMHTDLHLILILSLTKVYVLTWGVALLVERTEQWVQRTVQIEQRTEQQISIVERTEHFRAKSSASHCICHDNLMKSAALLKIRS